MVDLIDTLALLGLALYLPLALAVVLLAGRQP